MDEHEAAGIIFFGHDTDTRSGVKDMAGKPIVLLGYLTFLFLLLLVVVAYTGSDVSQFLESCCCCCCCCWWWWWW
jgi:hypothetical protein